MWFGTFDGDIRASVRELLESGYRVIEAADGEEGLAHAREAIPGLIITDVMMPKMDGYQMRRELKQDEKTSHIPIMMKPFSNACSLPSRRILVRCDSDMPAYLISLFDLYESEVKKIMLNIREESLRNILSAGGAPKIVAALGDAEVISAPGEEKSSPRCCGMNSY